MPIAELEAKTLNELQDVAKDLNIANFRRYRKQELIMRVLQAQTEAAAFALTPARAISTYSVASPSKAGQTGMMWGSPDDRTVASRQTGALPTKSLTG